jgi:hypothetical protein
MRRWLAMLLFVALCACSRQAMLDKIAPPPEQALARTAIADVAAGRAQHLAALMPPPLAAQIGPAMPQMQRLLPRGRLRLLEARFLENATSGVKRTDMLWEASDGAHYAFVTTVVLTQGANRQLLTLFIQPTRGPAESLYPFDLAGKSFGHYLMLLLCAASAATCLTACVLAIRSRFIRRRWLWAAGSLIGFGLVSIRWDTGELYFKLVNVELLGAMAARTAIVAPWQVGFGIPVFAILFLAKWRAGVGARTEWPAEASGSDA